MSSWWDRLKSNLNRVLEDQYGVLEQQKAFPDTEYVSELAKVSIEDQEFFTFRNLRIGVKVEKKKRPSVHFVDPDKLLKKYQKSQLETFFIYQTFISNGYDITITVNRA
jgi:hypothetical protein